MNRSFCRHLKEGVERRKQSDFSDVSRRILFKEGHDMVKSIFFFFLIFKSTLQDNHHGFIEFMSHKLVLSFVLNRLHRMRALNLE